MQSAALLVCLAVVSVAQAPQPDGAGLERGALPDHWPTGGPHCMEMAEFAVHEYNPNFFILRQSGCADYEKPFLYLIFGADKALLWDTGSRNGKTRETVDRVIERWLKVNDRPGIPLVIVHSHHHSDHVWGDSQFDGRPDTTMIKPDLDHLVKFFGFTKWPDEVRTFDLGERPLDLIPIPGHTDDSFALYDRRTGILLTGDTVYPGRLYVSDFPAFKRSIHRLALFTNGRLISHVLGNHIEETSTAYLEYPIGKMHQPDEHSLDLSVGTILELDRALEAMDAPRRLALRDLTIYPMDRQSSQELRDVSRATQDKDKAEVWK